MNKRSAQARRRLRAARQSTVRRCLLESLEDRRLLAGDLLEATDDGSAIVGSATAEREPAVDLVQFAKDLTAAGVIFYGADWCPFCNEQKAAFGDGSQFLDFREMTNPDRTRTDEAIALGIDSFPTWEFPLAGGGVKRVEDVLTLEELSAESGVPIPMSELPSVAPIEDKLLETTSPLHVPVDGYDPDGQPLTITVASSNPSVVAAELVTGNRSAVMTVENRGDITIHIFEQRAPDAARRFIELIESDYYDDVPFHRIVDSFVIQAGIGATTRPAFPDDFHPELQHNQPGVASYAKSTDDTNTTQFFITDRATPTLDYNHSVFGQVTEGDDVRASIQRAITGVQAAPVISHVELIEDTENGLVKLTPLAESGTSTITVTVEDADGNQTVETFEVTVVADTDNAAPFLLDDGLIRDAAGNPQVVTQRNVPVTINLEAFDAEGDAVNFNVTRRGLVPYEFSVAGNVLTVTPPDNFVGEMEIDVEVEQADGGVFNPGGQFDVTDNQTVAIAVTPAAPGALDLPPEFDTGGSSTDNVTSVAAPAVQVGGVLPNATVVVRVESGAVVGQAQATGTSVAVPVDLSAVGDGTIALTATQTFNGQTSPATPELVITLDTAAPDMGGDPPPASVDVGDLFSFDAETAEEAGAAFVQYSLSAAPDNMTINQSTGVVEWIPKPTQRGPATAELTATDLAGNASTLTLDVTAAGPTQLAFSLQVRDAGGGAPAGPFVVGDTALLDVLVEDVSDAPTGVKGAFFDIPLPAGLQRSGDAAFGPFFTLDLSGTSDSDIDEMGASSDDSIGASGQFLLVTIPLLIADGGDFSLQAQPADRVSDRYTDGVVDTDEIVYGSASITAVTPFVANLDERNIDEDSPETALTVLANDVFLDGFSGTLTVELIGSPTKGTARIAGNDVLYTPAADATGADEFTYVITDDQQRGTATGTVSIGIQPQNDPPSAADDLFDDIDEDSTSNLLDVLVNDVDIDGHDLRILQVGAPANGTATASPNGTFINYTPDADFDGVDTFTYVVTDDNGGTDTATVTIEIVASNDAPAANNDAATAAEDETVTVDVLANDDPVDSGETLTVTQVTPGAEGGTAVIANNQVVYTPPADFVGATTLVYTIANSRGDTAQAQVLLTFTGENDPPTAVDDPSSGTLTVLFNSVDHVIDVLANDFDNDDGDTLSIQSVDSFSAGGSATISNDTLLYTPAAGFSGSESFQYTIVDSLGQQSTATVTVEVLEFDAASLSGVVYLDADDDGVHDADESPISGVEVKLTGADQTGAAVDLSTVTGGDGAYRFDALRAGDYTLTEVQPVYLADGIDTIGSQGGEVGDDSFAIQLGEGVDGTGNNFGERGRAPAYRTIHSLFRSSSRRNVYVAVDVDSGTVISHWSVGPWTTPPQTTAELDADTGTLTTSVTHEGQVMTTGVSVATTNPVRLAGNTGNVRLFRVLSLSDFEQAASAGGGAESEPPVTLQAEGEPVLLSLPSLQRERFSRAATVDRLLSSEDSLEQLLGS